MIAFPTGFSPQAYLSLELESVARHEDRFGLVYAMARGSDDHSRLSINLLTAINLHLRDGDCQFFSGNVKVNDTDDFFITFITQIHSSPVIQGIDAIATSITTPN